ncbi:HAD family phosphatase [Roseovarius faecimaris]|uniref:HAD family phosphatase n=1 Tax=Roseovarius faecimaris TaxID=2494550 RepID=A0A6I6IRP6_9RHOB|nr:HAD family phosphatase [Roseovarius faecimaris]QGX99830.1 HAD family phosphatase [Roseovarius faecimaris]
MTVEAVVLDIGNVLITWAPERVYHARLGAERSARFFKETQIHAMNLEVDRGLNLHDAVEALAADHPSWAADIRVWRDEWLSLASPAIDRSARLMRALQNKGVPVFALSNFGVETFEVARAAYPFLNEFDRSFISGHMGMIKPEPGLYAALEAETGVAPGALLFTDDRPENIEAAQARGWQTHLFDGADRWAQVLINAGLLTKDEAR